ncbi:MAG: GAF sensor hybrid histidine kinase [Anaerolineaceae bacterium]|nr:MAG: GAF sensor hybrid histidine kinase [Anaerolineaceae bacterium]
MSKGALDYQLREISQASGAAWAVWLERLSDEWEVRAACHLTSALRSALLAALRQPPVMAWLNGALAAQRGRVRAVPAAAKLQCKKLGVFPDPSKRYAILAGADEFPAAATRLWRALASGHPGLPAGAAAPESVLPAVAIPDLGGVSYDLPQALGRLLDSLVHSVGCQGGWLAVRSGDTLEIKAQSNCPECAKERLPLDENPLLRKANQTRAVQFIRRDQLEWKMLPDAGPGASAGAWAGLPLVIGQRFIGLAALWRGQPFREEEQELLKRLAVRAAALVDESVTFSNLTDHLRRLALLNDFAITVSSALDLEQVAQRVFALLRRAFGVEYINLILLSPDGELLYHYYDSGGTVILNTRPVQEFPVLQPVHRGEVFRLDDVRIRPDYVTVYPDVHSALAVPMKFRRQVIGSLGLESAAAAAFSVYDEHLLTVIASHLAGLIENGRLRQEAEARARNLSLIHEVVEQIIGQTDVRQVAQTAAQLMARNFAYELAAVLLVRGNNRALVVEGIGGSAADIVRSGLQYMASPNQTGIVSRVAATGQSMLIDDVSQDPFYRPIPNWEVGSEMCVPLRDGERILGVLDVESQKKNAFTQSDLLLLESLAGILASVISNVGQYQELQATVQELQTAREELQQRVAAQRVAESRLVQAAKLAAVGEMAAGIAHELNNPLTTVAGFTELVLDDLPKDSAARADLELVLREASRARSVVLRLLDFARQGESVRVRADVNEILSDILTLVSHLLHTSGVSMQTEFANSPAWISVDRSQIKQVFLNLVHNALHAMPDGGKLSIKTFMRQREGRGWVTVSIRDTGLGISKENLSRIFEPFFTTRSKDGGTGLGLSVSYGIVTDHGGFIEVTSEIRKGSEFTVWLPVEVD